MQNTPTSPNPVYVYPLPAKTQGPQGDSKAYKISLGILWFCFALPIIAVIFNLEVLLLSYFSTNIFIIFFVVYFKFYKNAVFLILLIATTALIWPVLEIASTIEQKLPHSMYSLRNDGSPFVAHDIIIGIIFWFFFSTLNFIIAKIFKVHFQQYITPFILCATSSFYFFIFSLSVSNIIYECF